MRLATSPNDKQRPLYAVTSDTLRAWTIDQSPEVQAWIEDQKFKAGLGEILPLPEAGGGAILGLGTAQSRARRRFGAVANVSKLAPGTYALENAVETRLAEELSLGWLLQAYRFDRYAKQSPLEAEFVCPDGLDAPRLETFATGETITRDLINTPASDMGPEALEGAARSLADCFSMDVSVTKGDALIDQNFPMIHAVGRAAAEEPRLIDMSWGSKGPKVTLVGKGVCFDTGGLNLKPGGSMGLMKKDMGGAAHVLGLAQMIMALDLPVQLRVLIPAVENSVSSNSFRPQDILTSRKGLTVEINNTDAEGRLVLADALALADEDTPDLLISMATLTGAARVAVGPDLAPYYTDDAGLSAAIEAGAIAGFDPVWRMPFHDPYEAMIEPGIADLDNAPKGGFAGSITAALFLRRFVENTPSFAHFDVYGWQPTAAPGRPKGGVGQGCRALLAAIEARV